MRRRIGTKIGCRGGHILFSQSRAQYLGLSRQAKDVPAGISAAEIEQFAVTTDKVQALIEGKLVNIVIKG